MAWALQPTHRWLAALVAAILAWSMFSADAAGGEPRRVVVIELDGAIGPGAAGYVLRSLREAQQQHGAAVILQLDIPGGLDSATRDVVHAMLASSTPVLAYVAPSGARAASAGTYLLYAAALAAMAPGTNLGAATPVSLFGPTPLPGPVTTPAGDRNKPGPPTSAPKDALFAKITNDSVAYIRALAVLQGRNAEWAESAVREAVSLPYDAALDQHVVDLIASDAPELLVKADGRSAIVQGKPVRLATQGAEIVQVEPSWRDRLLALLTDPSIVYLLLLAGVGGIAFELSHPGVFAPGVVGAICLLLGGYGLNLLPVNYAGLALALLGLGLMTAEAFVPAFGAFVIGGVASFVIGSLMMFEGPGLRLPLGLVIGATLASAVLFGVVLTLLLRARRRPAVTGTAALIGLSGRIVRWTGLEGEILLQGERWQARAACPLQPGQAVRVAGRHGLTLLVEDMTSRVGAKE